MVQNCISSFFYIFLVCIEEKSLMNNFIPCPMMSIQGHEPRRKNMTSTIGHEQHTKLGLGWQLPTDGRSLLRYEPIEDYLVKLAF